MSPDFASWSIQGTSEKGAALAVTTFTGLAGALTLSPDVWTFNVRVMDASGGVIQTAQSTVTLVAGTANSAVFQLDPVIDLTVEYQPGGDPTWALVPTGAIQNWPVLADPFNLVLTAPTGFDSYVWILNGEVQPETGNRWETKSVEISWEELRFSNQVNRMQVLFSRGGQTYSLRIVVEMPLVG